MTEHPLASISAFADGELPEEEAARVAAHLAVCTECTRELALIRSMGEAMSQGMRSATAPDGTWERVHRRITQPIGWILVTAGIAVWAVLLVVEWFRSRELTLQWMATTAVGIGLALVAVGIGYEQYRDWKSSPYKDLER